MRGRPGLRLLALTSLALLTACPGAARQAPSPPPADVPAPATGPLTTLSRATWPGLEVRLLGVDTQRDEAWLWKADRREQHLALEIERVRLRDGASQEIWRATPAHARAWLRGYPALRPLDGPLERDAARLAQIVARTGPWSSRARDAPPLLTVTADAALFVHEAAPEDGQDGDWLLVRGPQGERLGRLDRGLRASYSPNLSPDGAEVAWRGCSPTLAARGKNCGYALVTAALPDGAPRVRAEVPDPTAPQWTPDGAAILTVARHPERACLTLAPRGPGPARALHCEDDARDPAALLSPSGATAALVTVHGDPQRPRLRWSLRALPGGEPLATLEPPEVAEAGLLVDDDTLLIPRQDGALWLIRPREGRQVLIRDPAGRLSGLSTARARASGGLVLLRQRQGGFDLVELDLARALSDSPPGG